MTSANTSRLVLVAAANDARAIDQHVEARQIVDQRTDRCIVANVERHRVATAEIRRAARGLRLGARRAGHRHDGAERGERVGDRRADAARAADDQRHLAGEQVVAERRRERRCVIALRAASSARTSASRGSGATAP